MEHFTYHFPDKTQEGMGSLEGTVLEKYGKILQTKKHMAIPKICSD